MYHITGIQQIGIGVPDVEAIWRWYRTHFGMDVPVFQEAAEAPLMTKYTGGVVQSRTATLAINMQGGGGFEIWQYTSRGTEPPGFTPELGDTGIFAGRIKSRDVVKSYQAMQRAGVSLRSEIEVAPDGWRHFFVQDPLGNLFDVVEGHGWFTKGEHHMGGPSGALLGVSNIDEARRLYTDVLGYDVVQYDETRTFADLAGLPGGGKPVRRVLLTHSEARRGGFSELFGPSQLELVEATDYTPRRIFQDRFWGDLGFIHLCFDVVGMSALKAAAEQAGFPFVIDSDGSFDMGEAAGRFSYVEDSDGTLIEFVETHKIPILKKVGWYLDLRKRDPLKPLPKWMLKTMALSRVKD